MDEHLSGSDDLGADKLGSDKLGPDELGPDELGPDALRHIARLAQLALSDNELASFSSDLARVVAELTALDGLAARDQAAVSPLERIAPRPSKDAHSRLRRGRPAAPLPRAAWLSQSEGADDGLVRVPRLRDQSERR